MGGGTDFHVIATSLTSAYNIAKALINVEHTLDKAELKLRLADLMVELANARAEAADMQSYLHALNDELADARKKLEFAGTMQYEAPYYMNVAGDKRDGPFCATCWDGHGKLAIRLHQASPGYWICNACKTELRDSTYRDPPYGSF